MIRRKLIVVGGGPAGLTAAIALKDEGIEDVLIVERERHLGGILRQCIHDGFGLTWFGESLSGPEYAQRLIDETQGKGIEYVTGTSVTSITEDRVLTLVSPRGLEKIQADGVVLAMGCRERTRGAIALPGERPAGVYTAGVAQAFMNVYNRRLGEKAVILGSGDIGMIMARRMTLEGIRVEAVVEIMPFPTGLPRNRQQCLMDFHIPLLLGHTVVNIHGTPILTGVTIAKVDERRRPIPGTERLIACDLLLLSVGLIPENELSLEAGVELDLRTGGALVDEHGQTGRPGIFAAGNVLHVHDRVDEVSAEARRMARGVSAYLRQRYPGGACAAVRASDLLGYVVPQRVHAGEECTLYTRLKQPVEKGSVEVWQGRRLVARQPIFRKIPAEMLQISLAAGAVQDGETIEVKASCAN